MAGLANIGGSYAWVVLGAFPAGRPAYQRTGQRLPAIFGARLVGVTDLGDADTCRKARWGQCWCNVVRRALTELWPQHDGQPQKAKLDGGERSAQISLSKTGFVYPKRDAQRERL